MNNISSTLSKDNKPVLICRSSSLNGPKTEELSMHTGRGFWYFSVDNGDNWKTSHIPSRTQLELKINEMNLTELALIKEL